jgi:hypothetical protein
MRTGPGHGPLGRNGLEGAHAEFRALFDEPILSGTFGNGKPDRQMAVGTGVLPNIGDRYANAFFGCLGDRPFGNPAKSVEEHDWIFSLQTAREAGVSGFLTG